MTPAADRTTVRLALRLAPRLRGGPGRRLLRLALALASMSCGHDGPTALTRDDLRGTWRGTTARRATLILHVDRDDGRTFSGSAEWLSSDTLVLSVRGGRLRQDGTTIGMGFLSPPRGPQTFTCDIQGVDNPICSGTLNLRYYDDPEIAAQDIALTISRTP